MVETTVVPRSGPKKNWVLEEGLTVLEYVIDRLSQWDSQSGVLRALEQHYGVTVSASAISGWARVHGEHIEAKREEFLGDFMDEPLAWRKVRVQKYSQIYRLAMGELDEAVSKAGTDKAQAKSKGKSYFYALEALKGIREEMEPIEAQLGKGSMDEVDEMIAKLETRLNPSRAELTGPRGNIRDSEVSPSSGKS